MSRLDDDVERPLGYGYDARRPGHWIQYPVDHAAGVLGPDAPVGGAAALDAPAGGAAAPLTPAAPVAPVAPLDEEPETPVMPEHLAEAPAAEPPDESALMALFHSLQHKS